MSERPPPPAPKHARDMSEAEYAAAKKAAIGSPVRAALAQQDAATIARFTKKHEKAK